MKTFGIKYTTFLVFAVLAMVFGIVTGCSDSVTASESSRNSSENSRIRISDNERLDDKIDELWVIGSGAGTRSSITMDEVIAIIEKNMKNLTTRSGGVDPELLRNFVNTNFSPVDTITDPDEIDAIINTTKICCKYDPATKTIRIIITVK